MVRVTVEEMGIFTVTDLERERDLDPRLRWELLEGELVMTPAPRFVHQDMLGRSYVRVLAPAQPPLVVALAPLDVRLSERTVLQPDLVVARREQAGDHGIEGIPLLVVEVLSPSTRCRDLMDKRRILERVGAGSWIRMRCRYGPGAWSMVAMSRSAVVPASRR